MSDVESKVHAVRSFNRFYTGVLGVLDEGLLESPYSLTEARVLFELARADATEVTGLRRALGLDGGYLSRLLARFEADGLIARRRLDTDARRQVISLTPRGQEVFADLDTRSSNQVSALLATLTEADQRRILGAMDAIGTLLGTADSDRTRTVVLREPEPGDYGWIIERNGALYAREYGWDATYEALVARIVADYLGDRDPHRERAWIAELDGEPVGCVFCVAKDDTTAKLRLLLVEPSARGMGVGTRLVRECLQFAKRARYREVTLWTNDVLTSARRVYEAAGFCLVDEESHRSFGHDLVGQNWAKEL